MRLSELERRLINTYQGGFPITEQPFRNAAAYLDCSEHTLLDTIHQLLHNGALSRFGPLYDAGRLGGGLTLAAMSVPGDRFEEVTKQVNDYREVAHNYRRDHILNMWFVLATATADVVETTINSIAGATGLKVYNFPKHREYYVGLRLVLNDDGEVTSVPVNSQTAESQYHCSYHPDETDRKIINSTQAGLPLVNCPYKAISDQTECSSDDVKQRLRRMLSHGIIRRIGVVPNHYRLGLKANGMTVWDVADDRVEELGNSIGQLDFVSHCYLRPRHLPEWRYNLFAMVHGHTRDEVDDKAKHIASLLGDACDARETLFSTAILKKTGMRLAA